MTITGWGAFWLFLSVIVLFNLITRVYAAKVAKDIFTGVTESLSQNLISEAEAKEILAATKVAFGAEKEEDD